MFFLVMPCLIAFLFSLLCFSLFRWDWRLTRDPRYTDWPSFFWVGNAQRSRRWGPRLDLVQIRFDVIVYIEIEETRLHSINKHIYIPRSMYNIC